MRTELIVAHVRALERSLGVARPPVPQEPLRRLYAARDFLGLIRAIRDSLRLDLEMQIGFVNKGGPEAPAWVRVPPLLPPYGTKAFRQTTVTMFLRKTFLVEAPFASVVSGVAHECSHLVLNSLSHPLREAEEAVDLTAMLLGYRDFFRVGCHYETLDRPEPTPAGLVPFYRRIMGDERVLSMGIRVHQLGYLSTKEIQFACGLMVRR